MFISGKKGDSRAVGRCGADVQVSRIHELFISFYDIDLVFNLFLPCTTTLSRSLFV